MVQRNNTIQNTGGGPLDWYNQIPPITKYYATIVFFVALASKLGFSVVGNMALFWPAVFTRFEIWRLVTNFFVLQGGQISLNFLFNLYQLVQYGPLLEKQVFFANPAQFLYMILLSIPTMCILNFVCTFLFGAQIYFMAGSVIMMWLYVACREYPDQNQSLWGIVQVKSIYMPYLLVSMSFLLGGFGSFLQDLIGMAAGHLWYFLTKVYGPQTGRDYLKVPKFIQDIHQNYIEGTPQGQGSRSQNVPTSGAGNQRTQNRTQQQQNNQQGGFRAFSGRSYTVN